MARTSSNYFFIDSGYIHLSEWPTMKVHYNPWVGIVGTTGDELLGPIARERKRKLRLLKGIRLSKQRMVNSRKELT